MNPHHHHLGSVLLFGVFFSLMGSSCSEKKPYQPIVDLEMPWREQKETFESHLSAVEIGWSKTQLLAHAGPPDEEESGDWFYKWEEDRIHGGFYSNFLIRFEGDTISGIKMGDGHLTRTPDHEPRSARQGASR